jgi:hypothetical protein
MTDTIETKIARLIEEIKAAEPLIGELQSRNITRGCAAARETLVDLGSAARWLLDEVYQQDFVSEIYEGFAIQLGDLCSCTRCRQLAETREQRCSATSNAAMTE